MSNLRKKIAKDINYQIEVVYFFMNFPVYKEKLENWYKDKSFVMSEYEKANDEQKKVLLRDIIVPDILENEKYHFNVAYWNMLGSKEGRMYLDFLKQNEPKTIK